MGSLPGSVVDGVKQTNKVMTDCEALQEIHKSDERDDVLPGRIGWLEKNSERKGHLSSLLRKRHKIHLDAAL